MESLDESKELSLHPFEVGKYSELYDFVFSYNYKPSYRELENLSDKINFYLDVGNRKGKLFLEKIVVNGSKPSFLHKFAKKTKEEKNVWNKEIVMEMLEDYDDLVGRIYFGYQIAERKQMNHWQRMKYIKEINKSFVENYDDINEAFAIGQKKKLGSIIIKRWDKKWVDNSAVLKFVKNNYENLLNFGKMKAYEIIRERVSKKFGRTMSLSTMYKYLNFVKQKQGKILMVA